MNLINRLCRGDNITLVNTKRKIKEIKVDAIYGKKKHFNAADRKQNYYKIINYSIMIINAVVGILIFLVIYFESFILKIISLVLAALVMVLTGIQINSNYCKVSEGHMNIGNRYLSLFKKCGRLEAYIDDKILERDHIINHLEEISSEIDIINKDAASFSTNKKDYNESKDGINEGEESYSDNELNL